MISMLLALSSCGRKPEVPQPEEAPAPVLPGSGLDAPLEEPVIRVRILAHRAAEPLELRIGSEGQWLRISTPDSQQPWALTAAAPVTLARISSGWQLVESTGYQPSVPASDVLHIAGHDEQSNQHLELNGRLYPGSFMLHPQTDASPLGFDLVEHVPLEQYLPGVLARELYAHWDVATHEAQAIAARSFACAQISQFSTRRHWDVTNTQQSQAYIGAVQKPRALEAVEQTRGIVLTWRGQLVPAYYCSCCGGMPARARDAIGEHQANEIVPLEGSHRPVMCQQCPLFSWQRTRDRAAMDTALRSFAKTQRNLDLSELGELAEIRTAEANAFGRPVKFALVDASGHSVIINAEQLRRACDDRIAWSDAVGDSLPSSCFSVAIAGDVATFSGHGHGHGVGMCQYGAQQMAVNGAAFPEILQMYYPDAQITQTY